MKINIEESFSLDIETEPTVDTNNPYALEPFRLEQGLATISLVAVDGPGDFCRQSSMDNVSSLVDDLAGLFVWAHNSVFDVAFLIAATSYDRVKKIRWLDTMLTAKWVDNSQKMDFAKKDEESGYSLRDIVRRHHPRHPDMEEFLDLKKADVKPGEDFNYWLKRGRMDAEFTRRVGIELYNKLSKSQIPTWLIEQQCIPATASSWLQGIYLDVEGAKAIRPRVATARKRISQKLGVPSSLLDSPVQVGKLLFETYGLEPVSRTPKGRPSSKKDDLLILSHRLSQAGHKHAETLDLILQHKQLQTLDSKYLTKIEAVAEYTKDGRSHSSPRIFGTYTGRFTYSSKSLRSDAFPIGIATHQIPRKGPVRGLLRPPPGYKVVEFDASGQESRGMAIASGDENMIAIFAEGKDFHAYTASRISGTPYETFLEKFHAGDKWAVNQRYNGKFVNLSCNYRIGDSALSRKAFTQYGLLIDVGTGRVWNNTFKTSYTGVPRYWKQVCQLSRQRGYTCTFGDRRYYLSDWSSHKWQTESSAINFPIQGFGGDMKELAIAMIAKKYPELIFALDLHDGIFYYVPDDEHTIELCLEVKHFLNTSLPYERVWDIELPIPLLWDAALGDNWRVKEIGYEG